MKKRILTIHSPTVLAKANGITKQRAFQLLHPERVRIARQTRRALKNGTLHKSEICQKCGTSSNRLEAHHPDYEKSLMVIWLCIACHKKEHSGVHYFVPSIEDMRPIRAAEQIGISKSLLSYYIKHGKVEVVIIGGVVLIPRSEVERLRKCTIASSN